MRNISFTTGSNKSPRLEPDEQEKIVTESLMSPWRAPCDSSVNEDLVSIADELDWNKENETFQSFEPKSARQNLMKSRHLFKQQSKLSESSR